ncbi:MAG: TetR/AcrR family transcriptional regulator [SAR324 cluster bacterium]|nr:TetR/AcrR family transcriptional regulator [SAR324 cluster bacterium]
MNKAKGIPTKERLLASGALLFSEKGFGSVSVREICKHAETSMNMIHHYFKSKEGLLEAILEQFSSSVFELPLRILDKPPRSKEDLLARLEMLFETTLDACVENRLLLLVILREQAKLSAVTLYIEKFAWFLSQGKEQGLVRKEMDTDMITGFLLDRIINQVQFAPWIEENYGASVQSQGHSQYKQQWCQANLDLFFNGILPSAQS